MTNVIKFDRVNVFSIKCECLETIKKSIILQTPIITINLHNCGEIIDGEIILYFDRLKKYVCELFFNKTNLDLDFNKCNITINIDEYCQIYYSVENNEYHERYYENSNMFYKDYIIKRILE